MRTCKIGEAFAYLDLNRESQLCLRGCSLFTKYLRLCDMVDLTFENSLINQPSFYFKFHSSYTQSSNDSFFIYRSALFIIADLKVEKKQEKGRNLKYYDDQEETGGTKI